jgi:hypothetical protein
MTNAERLSRCASKYREDFAILGPALRIDNLAESAVLLPDNIGGALPA